jgi:hypothetical protein
MKGDICFSFYILSKHSECQSGTVVSQGAYPLPPFFNQEKLICPLFKGQFLRQFQSKKDTHIIDEFFFFYKTWIMTKNTNYLNVMNDRSTWQKNKEKSSAFIFWICIKCQGHVSFIVDRVSGGKWRETYVLVFIIFFYLIICVLNWTHWVRDIIFWA